MLNGDPTNASPSDIDTELARLDLEYAKASNALHRLDDRVESLLDDIYKSELLSRIETARRTIADCEIAARPLDAEYKRRGGWTRAWLVLASGGHVHRTTECRTCFPTTKFAWLTQLSGQDEVGIVEQAGETACTECYPNAPVDVRNRPSRIKTPEQLVREAERAERAKVKAAKAITAPDGTSLRTKGYGEIGTEFTARRSYADALAHARYLARADIARHRNTIAEYHEDVQLILAALAAKHSRTEADLRADLALKVEARWTREYK